ncbi:phosphatase PAP2-related protein [Melioribacter sp. Ez-97]|uniref:phosphatase PAP2-related protein n=1 Tax=Melioribacter sp. Ez-97 TaxID=3423434 RepID=UPI003EDAB37A
MSISRELKNIWQPKLLNKSFRNRFFLSMAILITVLLSLAKFLVYNEKRPGTEIYDPVLTLFAPVDVTWLTFFLLYFSVIVMLVWLSFHPEIFLLAIQSYSFVALFRLITIYLLPLEAIHTIIPLKDPFVEFFGDGRTFLKDLFFSGHTATMFLFFLVTTNKKLKRIFFAVTVLVAICVLIQHVHYTVDVFSAPFFAYTSYRLAYLINSRDRNS